MTLLLLLWIAGTIAVPIWAGGGERARVHAITFGVVVQAGAVAGMLILSGIVWPVALIPFLGWVAEAVGSRSGIPFGRYSYTDLLRPQVLHVPVAVPFAWLMMVPPSWAVAEALVGTVSPPLFVIVAALAFTAWDLFLDPQMVSWRYWVWERGGAYCGVPFSNYLGWFLWAAALSVLYILLPTPERLPTSLPWIYVATWIFTFLGQMFFWKLRVSAVVGAVAMALFAVPFVFKSLLL